MFDYILFVNLAIKVYNNVVDYFQHFYAISAIN